MEQLGGNINVLKVRIKHLKGVSRGVFVTVVKDVAPMVRKLAFHELISVV